jgi:Pyruvate/2-oxoacid:ferredoxin oxidoreductase delta subunit
MIAVDSNKCIGCSSCSNVCPSKLIAASQEEVKRKIHFAPCEEYCDICVESCPEKALTLVPREVETTLVFDLVECKVCGQGFSTEPMLKKVKTSVPEKLQVDTSGSSWIDICPSCRREIESEKASRRIVETRR